MMNRTPAGTLRLEDAGKKITLAGWVQKRRDFGELIFIDLRDRTGICQVVVDQSLVSNQELVDRAKEVLLNLERGELEGGSPRLAKPSKRSSMQIGLFDPMPETDGTAKEIVDELKAVDPNNMTPIDALKLIEELVNKLNEKK